MGRPLRNSSNGVDRRVAGRLTGSMNRKMDRRDFLRTAGVSVAGGLMAGCLRGGDGTEPLRLVFFTDVHARPGDGIVEALEHAAAAINRLKPDLVIGGGDFIHGGMSLGADEARPRFGMFRAFREQIEARTELILGNHDLVARPPAAAVAEAGDWDPRAPARSELGLASTWRSLELRGIRFLLLDVVELRAEGYRGFVPADQMAWLESELAETPADQPIVLVSHIPLRSTFKQMTESPVAPLPPNLVVENGNEVLKLFEGRSLRLVLQGHLHFDETIRVNRTTFLVGGAVCGGWWKGSNLGTPEGFAEVRWESVDPLSEYMTYGWSASGK